MDNRPPAAIRHFLCAAITSPKATTGRNGCGRRSACSLTVRKSVTSGTKALERSGGTLKQMCEPAHRIVTSRARWSRSGRPQRRSDLGGFRPWQSDRKIAALIPDEWVGNPWWLTRIFEGDYRDFDPYNGTSRIQTVYDVFNPAVNDGDVYSGPHNTSGLTVEYDKDSSLTFPPFGNITGQARADWCWEDCGGTAPRMKTRWAFGDTSGTNCSAPQRLGPQRGCLLTRHQLLVVGVDSVPTVSRRQCAADSLGPELSVRLWSQ